MNGFGVFIVIVLFIIILYGLFGSKNSQNKQQEREYEAAKQNSSGIEKANYIIRDRNMYFIIKMDALVLSVRAAYYAFVDAFYSFYYQQMETINNTDAADEIGESIANDTEAQKRVSAHAFGIALVVTLYKIAQLSDGMINIKGLKDYIYEKMGEDQCDDVYEGAKYAYGYLYDPMIKLGESMGSWEIGAITNSMLDLPVEPGHYADIMASLLTGSAILHAYASDTLATFTSVEAKDIAGKDLITTDKKLIKKQNNDLSKERLKNLEAGLGKKTTKTKTKAKTKAKTVTKTKSSTAKPVAKPKPHITTIEAEEDGEEDI